MGQRLLGFVLVAGLFAVLLLLYEKLPDHRGILIFGTIFASALRR